MPPGTGAPTPLARAHAAPGGARRAAARSFSPGCGFGAHVVHQHVHHLHGGGVVGVAGDEAAVGEEGLAPVAAGGAEGAGASAGGAAGATGLSTTAVLSAGGGLAEQQVLSLRLQQLEATTSRLELGRVVIRMESVEQLEGTEDDIILEARDRIMMPTPSQTVSIIGSVKNPSTVVYRPSLGLDDYLRQAGGLTEDANKKEMYVMRANGTTDSAYLAVKDLRSGDTIVVPQKIEARTPQLALWQTVASIIGSVALTAAGIAVVGR